MYTILQLKVSFPSSVSVVYAVFLPISLLSCPDATAMTLTDLVFFDVRAEGCSHARGAAHSFESSGCVTK
jgi:hypothetical protein